MDTGADAGGNALSDSESFVKGLVAKYYKSAEVKGPPEIEKREFGIGDFGRKIAARHLAFADAAGLNRFLRTEAPLYISYSAAYYRFAARRPMDAKESEGSDLIYEFDANDLKCECAAVHNTWSCRCGASGRGNPEKCPECGAAPDVKDWVCEKCLGATKKQASELIEMLASDLALDRGIAVNFSGNRGYHIHVRDESIRGLSKDARIEILDYLTAHGMAPKYLGFYLDQKTKRMHCPKEEGAVGWGARILEGIEEIFKMQDAELLAAVGNLSMRESKDLLKESNTVVSGLRSGILHQMPGKRTERFWNALISHVVDAKRLSIDRQTSADISKIIRVPGTIHGSTGLLAKEVGEGQLREFSPLRDAVVLPRNSVKVRVQRAPKFALAGMEFGPFENEAAELPAFAAAYLIGRGAARIEK